LAAPAKIRFYVLQVLRVTPTLLGNVVDGPYRSLPIAWEQAGQYRALRPDKMFIAGEMCVAPLAADFSDFPGLKRRPQ
jgi:hypothetical protein